MVYDASSVYAWKTYGQPAFFFLRQLFFLIFSVAAFFAVLLLDSDYLQKYSREFLLANIILLVLVLFLGDEIGGSRRWLSLGPINFQPSELLKLSFLLYCSAYFVRKKNILHNFKQGLLPLIVVTAVVFCLLLLEPDLGAVVFWSGWLFLMFFVVRLRRKYLFWFIALALLALGALIFFFPYRLSRLLSYLDPWSDPQGSGFQAIQSQVGFSRGGFLGLGLGDSKQKLLFLPAAHTDFIFSIIAEEFGFWGTSLVLGIYFFILAKLCKVAKMVNDLFARYVCLGIAYIFGLELIINIGVVTSFLPTKGIALPFISYGGSNLLVHYLMFAIFFNLTKDYGHETIVGV